MTKEIYKDTFFSIGTWLYSGTLQIFIGIVSSIFVGIFTDWIVGAIIFLCFLISALASYIVLKK